MGHIKRKRPKRGAKQVWPRKRAKREYPTVSTWSAHSDLKPLAFAGYKAGMTHIHVVDNRPKSPMKGEEIRLPVTIIECPDLLVAGFRLYSIGSVASPRSALLDVLSPSLDSSLARKIKLPKKANSKVAEAEKLLEKAGDVRLLVYTQPGKTLIGKKKPELFEVGLGGKDVNEKFNYAKEQLGKSISVDAVFKDGVFLDVHAVTTGKGFQGVIKRFGVKLRSHKSEKGQRRIGTLGPWTPKKTPWWVPMSGQMGYHTRTHYNKQLLKIGDSKADVVKQSSASTSDRGAVQGDITPNGGILKYGKLKNKYMLIRGSVAGPKKRMIIFTHAIRKHPVEEAPTIISVSRRSQQ